MSRIAALAKLQVVFTAPLNTLQWIITAYFLAMGVSIPLAIWLTGLAESGSIWRLSSRSPSASSR